MEAFKKHQEESQEDFLSKMAREDPAGALRQRQGIEVSRSISPMRHIGVFEEHAHKLGLAPQQLVNLVPQSPMNMTTKSLSQTQSHSFSFQLSSPTGAPVNASVN